MSISLSLVYIFLLMSLFQKLGILHPTCATPLTNDIDKYLDVFIMHGRISKHTYGNLINKFNGRLASGK